MKFSRISVTKKGVELDFERKDDEATEEVKWSSHYRPLSAFTDALQSFDAYIVDLIPFLAEVQDSLRVTTLNLSEDKNGLRGLIVTATTPVEKAYNKPLVLNTPLVREGGENASDDAFVLSDEVLDLIALVESEARRYKNGEHEQVEMFSKEERTATSENAKNFDENAAAAEVKSTRKPRAKKHPNAGVPEQLQVQNPDATEPPLDDPKLRQLLLQAERDVSVDAIARWTATERAIAESWARATVKKMLGTVGVLVPAEPECVVTSSNPVITADQWTDPATPPKAADVDAVAIQDAARG